MKTFVQPGETLDLTAPTGGVVSGTGYLIGVMFVIAAITVAEGATFTGVTEGVFTLPKATGAAWTEGAAVYWDNTNKVVTTTASGNTKIGVAIAAAASGDTSGKVRLNGSY